MGSLGNTALTTAILHRELQETVFMKQRQGYDDEINKVYLLERSHHGLEQAPRCWNKHLGDFRRKLGFRVSEADPCLYIPERDGKKLILIIYVDGGLLVAATDL